MQSSCAATTVNSTRPTVILVSNHGEIIGGGELSLLTLLKGLDRSFLNPILVVPSEGRVAASCRASGIEAYAVPLPGLRRPSPKTLGSVWALVRLIQKTGAVLLHANGSRAMFYAGVAGRLCRRPVIWHLRILDQDPSLDWLLARLATRSIAISQPVRARLTRWPRAHDHCTVVPNGIDLTAFASSKDPETVRISLGLRPCDRIIGTVGRLVAFKGQRYLLEAFSLVRQCYPAITLLVVGDGPERDTLERDSHRLGISDHVRFTGHREDVADLLSVMEIFVLPSLAEHFGRVLLEAMAMKLPIVATDAGGVPEIVENNVTGLLIPPADPAGLAKAISELLGDPSRARMMGAAGRGRAEQHFEFRMHARRVEAIYAEALREL